MKYILLPIHPEWCCKLMNGDKETEVRRGTALYNAISNLIKEQGKAPCLIYCTKGQPYLVDKRVMSNGKYEVCSLADLKDQNKTACITPKSDCVLNGKVVAMFEAQPDRIFNVRYGADEDECDKEHAYETSMMWCEELERSSCLEYDQLLEYLGREWADGYIGTAIHVKQGTMKTFDKAKNLSDYGIKRAPQSWCYVEVDE